MDAFDLIQYLLRQRVIAPECIVREILVVQDATRRNRNFVVLREQPGHSLFVKIGSSTDRQEFIRHECEFYTRSAACIPEFYGEFLPALVYADQNLPGLILEHVEDTSDLRRFLGDGGDLSGALGARLGRALSSLHRSTWDLQHAQQSWQTFARPAPPPLQLHKPNPLVLAEISGANFELIFLLQRDPTYCEVVDRLNEEWEMLCMIHADLRWENILVVPESPDAAGMRIVDWELARLGDPCWDVGSVLHDFLYTWVQSMPVSSGLTAESQRDLAQVPLEKVVPCAQAFWMSYVEGMKLKPKQAATWLIRCLRFAALRLVQRAFEQLQTLNELSGSAVACLQLGLNVMKRPAEASFHLLCLHNAG